MFTCPSINQLLFHCDSLQQAVLTCLLLGTSYVGSLYVWRTNLPRDDPGTIKRRSVSACMISLLAPFCIVTQAHQADSGKGYSLWQYLGVRQAGLLPSLCLPLLLTMTLFLGPLYMMFLSDIRRSFPNILSWKDGITTELWKWHIFVFLLSTILYLQDQVLVMPKEWWTNSRGVATSIRNYVVGPITEEIVFRACMLPLLVPCLGNLKAVFICPLFFGVAHVHHVIESLRQGVKRTHIIWFGAIFQFFYTTVFGALSAFIFLRTGHLTACILSHMFCNFMGFPAFEDIPGHSRLQRVVICVTFIVGLFLFLVALFPLTNPEWYANEVYHWS